MKISIVIPSLNCAKYLPRTLDSIFNQSYKDFEVIVVDGFSTDGTKEILLEYRNKYPDNLVISLRKPKGQSDAINEGMELAKGDIVAYLCADDTLEEKCFLLVHECFIGFPDVQWIYGRGKIIDKDDREARGLITNLKEILQPRYSYTVLQCVDFIVQPTVFMRKSFYQQVGVFNTNLKYCMDYEYWLRAGKFSKPMFINWHLANWRCHGNSLSVREYQKQAREALEIQKEYSSWWLRPIQWKVYWATIMLYRSMK